MASGKRGPPAPGSRRLRSPARERGVMLLETGGCRGRRSLPGGQGVGVATKKKEKLKKNKKSRGSAGACWVEGGAEKYLRRVNLWLRAAPRLAGTYANVERVLGRAGLGLFPEAAPCRAAPALSPVPVRLGNTGHSCFPAPLSWLLPTALSFC